MESWIGAKEKEHVEAAKGGVALAYFWHSHWLPTGEARLPTIQTAVC